MVYVSSMTSERAIYVESFIHTTTEQVWQRTQRPAVHQRWDVRFTTIDYLPRANDADPQQFLYATKVLPGIYVSGCGETLGERHRDDGTAYSGLRFWSDHPLSLICQGSGYWRYVPASGGVRFLTRYDYTVRWGWFGRLVDSLFFRRLFGWGTAWSFDRLRIWIEHDITPEHSLRRSLIHAAAITIIALLVAVSLAAALGAITVGMAGWSLAVIGLALAAVAVRRTHHNRPSGRRPLRRRPPKPPTAQPITHTREAHTQEAHTQEALTQ